jgi:SAM-dependent methyltransferase
MQSKKAVIVGLIFFVVIHPCLGSPLLTPSSDQHTREDALKFWNIANTAFAPLYGTLAEQIVSDFQLADKEGIGIDLGSGPGNLIIELCKRTKQMHWVNADINPHFFPLFGKAADAAGVGHRVSSIFADAQALPFRDNYAEIIVSRGSFHLWEDKRLAFSEIYRVLKPGGVAFVGRGFSENLPVEIARRIRSTQEEKGSRLKYDVADTAAELVEIMKSLRIDQYEIRIPKPAGGDGVNYGIWLEFHKPAGN